MQKMVVCGLGVTQGHQQYSHSTECIRLPFRFFNQNYTYILYRFSIKSRFLYKVVDFNPPNLHLSPRRGNPVRIGVIFGIRKLQSKGNRVALFAWSYVQPFWYNTGVWQTDRHKTTAYTAIA